ncbi:SLATT domain-containing protein [Aliarcobacter butzleri]|uniref:SLATT domain-containing protein n=1 Tax=Aliarcobacter butzleri TaxID=28197 RepID=UPI00215A89D2|nr:SLATT domain-containing protein [Aliarcobacter butzleri]MCR8711084.1 SLATT domain-containing protein [Aliarcobacter butzleri]MCT7651399.1 SLATT domain-containing protein [Aliarcobacter butzleri]
MDINNSEIIKRSLGNVIYSQKTQIMAIRRKSKYNICIKWLNIILVGIIFFVLFLQIFNQNDKYYLYAGIFFTVIETLFLIFQLSFNPEKEIIEHKITANRLWLMREKHLNLLTDIKNEIFDFKQNAIKRDELTNELNEIYKNAPQTSRSDYKKAEKALNTDEKPRADDEEMENFLPENLR